MLANYVSPKIYEYVEKATTYEEAIIILRDIFNKAPNEIFSRHRLRTRRQQQNETVDQYIQALQLLSRDCGYRAVSAEEHRLESIRDAFISGLSDSNIRRRLLENSTLSMDDAVTQAESLEFAQKNAEKFLSTESTDLSVSVMSTKRESESEIDLQVDPCCTTIQKGKKCYFCGLTFHKRPDCPAKEASCRNCGKRGHYARVCRSNSRKMNSNEGSVNSLLCSIDNKPTTKDLSRVIVRAKIFGKDCKALLDSGSSLNFINRDFAERINQPISPCSSMISMASISLTKQIKGYCLGNIRIRNNDYKRIKLFILEDLCTDIILGQDFMSLHKSFQINFDGDRPAFVCSLRPMAIDAPSLFTHLDPNIRPIACPSRRFSQPDKKFIKEEVNHLLKEGIIELSSSPWRAQVLVTSNKRHKKRMVVDYSGTINRFTQLDAFPLPNINDIAKSIAQYKIFSRLDLKSAYYQLPIKEEEKLYTAFEADGQLFQFCRLPFGLTNAVAAFQREMLRFINKYDLKGVFCYIDDLIVGGKNDDEHDFNLRELMVAAEKQGLTFNQEKCEYKQTKINFLGFEIEDGKLRPDPKRLQPLKDLPLPKSKKELQRIVGLFSYYSGWIPNYSDKIHGLSSATSFPLDDSIRKQFDSLKQDIINSAVFSIDPDKPLVVETDASDYALAASLTQEGKPVAFFSKTLSQAQRHFPSVEKEAAAIVESLRKWRHYLLGNHFTLVTDQKSVSFMLDQKNRSKIKNDKILRWRIELSMFTFDIQYRPGKLNAVADPLSRISCCSSISSNLTLESIHRKLCHPGVTRLLHYVRSKNLPFSTSEVRDVCNKCRDCSFLKPQFYRPPDSHVVKATQSFERINMDFVGPKESSTPNKYLLILTDEYSRFPFVFPTKDMSASTVIKCLSQLFSMFGLPAAIHSDRGTQFMSNEVKKFLFCLNVSQTRTTPYNPAGNAL